MPDQPLSAPEPNSVADTPALNQAVSPTPESSPPPMDGATTTEVKPQPAAAPEKQEAAPTLPKAPEIPLVMPEDLTTASGKTQEAGKRAAQGAEEKINRLAGLL